MTRRKTQPDNEQAEEHIDDEPQDTELSSELSPINVDEPLQDIDPTEYDDAFGEQPPKEEELAQQYSAQFLNTLINHLPDFANQASWDNSLFMTDQGELMEQYVEALNQLLQIIRTQTFTELDDLRSFLIDIIQFCDTLPPVVVAYSMVKYHIRANRPN